MIAKLVSRTQTSPQIIRCELKTNSKPPYTSPPTDIRSIKNHWFPKTPSPPGEGVFEFIFNSKTNACGGEVTVYKNSISHPAAPG